VTLLRSAVNISILFPSFPVSMVFTRDLPKGVLGGQCQGSSGFGRTYVPELIHPRNRVTPKLLGYSSMTSQKFTLDGFRQGLEQCPELGHPK